MPSGDWIYNNLSHNSGATLTTLTLKNVATDAKFSLKFAGDYSAGDFKITSGTTTTTIAHT